MRGYKFPKKGYNIKYDYIGKAFDLAPRDSSYMSYIKACELYGIEPWHPDDVIEAIEGNWGVHVWLQTVHAILGSRWCNSLVTTEE